MKRPFEIIFAILLIMSSLQQYTQLPVVRFSIQASET